MQESGTTDIRIASILRDQNGVVVITMKDCGMIDEYDIMDLNLVIRHKAAGKPALKLVIATGDFDFSKKAKAMAEKEDNISQTRARAIVVSNSVKASVLNFLKQFNDRSYPQQFFSGRDQAYGWLLSFSEHKHNEILF
jgi:hypothetical protein